MKKVFFAFAVVCVSTLLPSTLHADDSARDILDNTKVDAVVGYRTDNGDVKGYGGVVGARAKTKINKSVLNMRSHEIDGEVLVGGIGDGSTIGSGRLRAIVRRDEANPNGFGLEFAKELNPITNRSLVRVLYARKIPNGNLVLGIQGGGDYNRLNATHSSTVGARAEGTYNINDLFDVSGILDYSMNFGQGREMLTEIEIVSPTEQITRVTRTGMRQDGWNGVTTAGAAVSKTFGKGTLSLHGIVQDRQSKVVEYGFEDIAKYEDDSRSLEFGVTATIPIK